MGYAIYIEMFGYRGKAIFFLIVNSAFRASISVFISENYLIGYRCVSDPIQTLIKFLPKEDVLDLLH